MKPQELGLNCEALEEFRMSLDTALKILIDRMTEKDMETGTVTAKIKISVHTETQDNGNPVRIVKMEPDVGLKIGAKGAMKCRQQDMFMKFDQDGVAIVGGKQMEIDDYLQTGGQTQ